MANSVNYQLLKLYWMRNKHQFGVRSKLYIYNFICMTVFGIVFLVSLCCSFKKINMFSFQKHYYVLIILKFFPKFWVNTISISKITVKQVVWKHLFVIYLRLLPVFSINRAGWAKFYPKTTLHNASMIPDEKSLPEVIDLSIFGRRYFGLNKAITKI